MGYESIQDQVYIKIDNFPLIEKIRDLRCFHINTLVKIKGVITRRYPTHQKLMKLYYICLKCGDRKGPYTYQDDDNSKDFKFGECLVCQSKGPYKIDQKEKIYGSF